MTKLLLIPTETEKRIIMPRLSDCLQQIDCRDHAALPIVQICGFGLVAAAARTSSLLFQCRPSMVLLAGITGSLSNHTPVGSAHEFSRVRVDGIGVGGQLLSVGDEEVPPTGQSGVGSMTSFQSAGAMGWPHWPGDADTPEIGDMLELSWPGEREMSPDRGEDKELLSVCAASADCQQAERRRRAYPDAVAEDMEGFGVALACRLAAVPLRIFRGISNLAGDREKSNWRTAQASFAVAELLFQCLRRTDEMENRVE